MRCPRCRSSTAVAGYELAGERWLRCYRCSAELRTGARWVSVALWSLVGFGAVLAIVGAAL